MPSSALQLWSTTRTAFSCLQQGQLHTAAALLSDQPQRQAWPFSWLAAYVTRRLVKNAYWHWAQRSFNHAWADFAAAEQVCADRRRDWLQSQKSRLVEETIASADQQLSAGQTAEVIAALDSLEQRGVRDWRATRSLKAARSISAAENFTRHGDWPAAVRCLEEVVRERPELYVFKLRLEALRRSAAEFHELKQQLHQAICGRRLTVVRELAEKLLAISPEDPTAVAALRRMEKSEAEVIAFPAATLKTKLAESAVKRPGGVTAQQAEISGGIAVETAPDFRRLTRFMLWIDGVGGYLVCPGPVVTAGSYVEQPGVEISLQADLRRRHLRIERNQEKYVLIPLGPTRVNGKAIRQPTSLTSGSRLELPGQVCWQFSQTHPLSSSARLDYCSPHRTVPSSDGILLLADTLIIGPHRCNHVYCPDWPSDLILFRRQDQLFLRSELPLRVDGQARGLVTPLCLESSVSGAGGEFSLKLEPV